MNKSKPYSTLQNIVRLARLRRNDLDAHKTDDLRLMQSPPNVRDLRIEPAHKSS